MSWYNEVTFYHIYPLGACGAPMYHDGTNTDGHRILTLLDWIPHLQELGIGAVYLGPVFESMSHGYDTVDYTKVDSRLGNKEDLTKVIRALHDAGIRVVLDGVFNHVGRGHSFYQDVLVVFQPALRLGQPFGRPLRLQQLGWGLEPGQAGAYASGCAQVPSGGRGPVDG